jgi:hypothetical protein
MPTLADIRAKVPELQGLDDNQALDVIHQVYYPTADKAVLASKLGMQLPKPPTEADSMGDTARGFKTAMLQLPQTAGGAIALAGDAIGSEGMREYGMGIYDKNTQKIADLSKESDSLTNVMEGDASAADWMQYAAGYTGGQAVTAVATGGLGGFIGAQLAKRGIREVVARGAQSAIAKQVAGKVASTGAKIGAGVGLTGQNLMQEAGSIYPEAREQAQAEGRELDGGDLARVGAAAVGAAAVDTAMDAVMLGRVMQGGRKALTDSADKVVLDAAGKPVYESMKRAAAREVPMAMGREAVTEGIQTGIERAGAGKELTTADAIREYVDSIGMGAVGGGLGGGASVLNTQKVPESGPLSKAANAGIDEQIKLLANDPDPLVAFPDGSVGTKTDLHMYLQQFDDPQERIEKERELMGRDPKTGKRIEPEPAEPPKAAQDQEEADANIKAWSRSHDAVDLDYAQGLLQTPAAKGLELMIAPHASGKGYTVIPSRMLSVDDQVKAQALQKADASKLPGPDTKLPGGNLVAGADGVRPETYGDRQQADAERKKREELGITAQRVGKPAASAKVEAAPVANAEPVPATKAEPAAQPAPEPSIVGRYTKIEPAQKLAERYAQEDQDHDYTVAEKKGEAFSWFMVQKTPKKAPGSIDSQKTSPHNESPENKKGGENARDSKGSGQQKPDQRGKAGRNTEGGESGKAKGRVSIDEETMQRPEGQGVSELRREGDQSLRAVDDELQGVPVGHGGKAKQKSQSGKKGQQRPVQSGELHLGAEGGSNAESTGDSDDRIQGSEDDAVRMGSASRGRRGVAKGEAGEVSAGAGADKGQSEGNQRKKGDVQRGGSVSDGSGKTVRGAGVQDSLSPIGRDGNREGGLAGSKEEDGKIPDSERSDKASGGMGAGDRNKQNNNNAASAKGLDGGARFDTIADANAAMLKAAESTGRVHEVVENTDGAFAVQPVQENADASDDGGRSDQPAAGNEPVDVQRPDGDRYPAGQGRTDAGKPGQETVTDPVAASEPADGQPALDKQDYVPGADGRIFGMSPSALGAKQGGGMSDGGAWYDPELKKKRDAEEAEDRRKLVEKQKAENEKRVTEATVDPRIMALKDAGIPDNQLLMAAKELREGDDSLVKDLARIIGIALPESNSVQDPQPEAAPDDGSDIPVSFFKKVKVDHDVYIEDEQRTETVKVSAKDALASVREDLDNYRKLLNCMKG